MRSGVDGATPDSVSLAIALFQAPGRFSDLLHGRSRLPPGMAVLLHLAAGGAAPADAALPPFVSAGELKQAARFFVEQVLLVHSADYYRVLGVDADAPPEEIKENHRLLMRLFHPDRQAIPEERNDAFATRINQAYSALRSPASRAAYDASLRQPKAAAGPLRHAGPGRYVPAETRSFLQRVPPLVARNFPQFVLGGVALVAVLSVSLVYLNRVPPGAIGAGEGNVSRAPVGEPPRLARAELPAAAPAAAPPPAPAEAPLPRGGVLQESALKVAATDLTAQPREERSGTAVDAAPAAPAATPASVAPPVVKVPAATPAPVAAEVRRAAEPRPAPVVARSDAGARSPPPRLPPPEAAPAVARQAPMAEISPAAPPAVAQKVSAPVEAPAVEASPPPPPQGLRPDELGGVLARLSGYYKRGDLEGLMSLFDEGARAERGGKARIRSDYDDLFRTTEVRDLLLWDVAWTRHGDTMRGEGSYRARVLRRGEGSARVYNGSIRIEVVKRNEAPLILGLFHTPG